MSSARVVILGSGFAGTILGRILHAQGHSVTLLERAEHPRFAVGESSTPLAAICLERLAKRYGLDDLLDLAEYGRWLGTMPEVRRGLKRGFTFYGHVAGEPYRNGEHNDRRLLVAASPSDHVADAHWLRSDVDARLAEAAAREGVELLERFDLEELTAIADGFRVAGVVRADESASAESASSNAGGRIVRKADVVIDATGPGGALARALDLPGRPVAAPRTGCVFGHFEGVLPFHEVATEAALPAGPYPDERAAVHHILDDGWFYALRFDHGVTSAGAILGPDVAGRAGLGSHHPEEVWARVLGRYPTLAGQFADARPIVPLAAADRLQRRLGRAAGDGWAVLPYGVAFFSPMFSTGIAWSLLGVERLAQAMETGGAARQEAFARYERRLLAEADHVERLTAGAYAAMDDFDLFVEGSYLYFVAASWAEASQRLLDPPGDAWCDEGFLGATDPALRGLVANMATEVRRLGTREDRRRFAETLRGGLRARNVSGLADDARDRSYPVIADDLVDAANLLGLDRDEMRRRLGRLRGWASVSA